jgi:hypothetical protein
MLPHDLFLVAAAMAGRLFEFGASLVGGFVDGRWWIKSLLLL